VAVIERGGRGTLGDVFEELTEGAGDVGGLKGKEHFLY
jgi:hypothetical protein